MFERRKHVIQEYPVHHCHWVDLRERLQGTNRFYQFKLSNDGLEYLSNQCNGYGEWLIGRIENHFPAKDWKEFARSQWNKRKQKQCGLGSVTCLRN